MKFYRVYVELTNICGLKCSFCPPKTTPSTTMSLKAFETALEQLQGLTDELALHVMGDPLILSNLHDYLDVCEAYGFRVMLTTSGYYLSKHTPKTLWHPCIKQLNISLNSFNKNETTCSFEAYFEPIANVAHAKPKAPFLNLRLWNLDALESEDTYNEQVYQACEKWFTCKVDRDVLRQEKPKTYRLMEKVLLHFDHYFEWPSLQSTHCSHGKCQGLQSHIAILADGSVVPCCLDGEGVINLGNLFEKSLENILITKKTQTIREGFIQGIAMEQLCQKCTYKERFNKILS